MYSKNRLLQAGTGLALCLFGMTAAVAAVRSGFPAPSAASVVDDRYGDHVQQHPLTWDQRPPLPSSKDHLRRDYDRPPARSIAADCDVNTFGNASGAALVTAVKAASVSCINSLFVISGADGARVFPEAKMVAIADAMRADSATYPGSNAGSMMQLVLYLRAGYYVQWYNAGDVGDYGAPLANAIRPALDAFVANSHFRDVNDIHGEILSEFVILIDSSAENAHQLDTVRGILDRYGPSHHPYWYMKSAVNSVFTVLFRGHYNADFRTLVQGSGSGVLDTLRNFVSNNKAADVGSDREYMLQNAAGELGRFLNRDSWYGYPEPFHSTVHPKAKSVLDAFAMTGPGAGIFVRLAGVVDWYDHEHCSYFGLCTFSQDLEAQILPPANARDCSATLRVRSQALTPAQLDTVCAIVGGEEGYFHAQAQTGNVPVANDHNDRLEMVIFHSSTDYETYSGIIFGNDTNNGGIYLEGDPSVPGNQARFLAYEAEWERPNFEVWNLTHEYIHYLDGRFNWYGKFSDYPMDAPASAIWFIEGFAEYMSYSYRNLVYASAVNEARSPDRFTLAQLFDTEYSTDYARTYQWGYLATRFMFERHHDDITGLFTNVSRPGNYRPGYTGWLDPIRTAYNAEFRAWVVCFATNNGDTSSCGGPQPGQDKLFSDGFDGEAPVEIPECTGPSGRLDDGCKISHLSAPRDVDRVWLSILVPAGKSRLVFTVGGGTGDADIYQKFGGWPGDVDYDNASTEIGNEETITVTNPAQGWHYLMLKPKSASFEDVEVSAAWQ